MGEDGVEEGVAAEERLRVFELGPRQKSGKAPSILGEPLEGEQVLPIPRRTRLGIVCPVAWGRAGAQTLPAQGERVLLLGRQLLDGHERVVEERAERLVRFDLEQAQELVQHPLHLLPRKDARVELVVLGIRAGPSHCEREVHGLAPKEYVFAGVGLGPREEVLRERLEEAGLPLVSGCKPKVEVRDEVHVGALDVVDELVIVVVEGHEASWLGVEKVER